MPPLRSQGSGSARSATNRVNDAHFPSAVRSIASASAVDQLGSNRQPLPAVAESRPSTRSQTEHHVRNSQRRDHESDTVFSSVQVAFENLRVIDLNYHEGPSLLPPRPLEQDLRGLSGPPQNSPGPEPQSSFVTQTTNSLSDSHQNPKLEPAWDFRQWGFGQRGRLLRDDMTLEMDDQPTQRAPAPAINPRERKRRHEGLDENDLTDIICILSPATPSAFRAVQLVAKSAGQHILQNTSSISGPAMHNDEHERQADADQMTVDGGGQTNGNQPALDIALRMSSNLVRPWLGFTFGRDANRSDIVIRALGADRHVSQLHFRIFITSTGSLLCEDMSTNGTWVDGTHLYGGGPEGINATDRQRTLHEGSTIEVMIEANESLMFHVSVPERSPHTEAYGARLDVFIRYLVQCERQKKEENRRRSEGLPLIAPVPVIPFNQQLEGFQPSSVANRNLVAGTAPYNHGSEWSGGDTYRVTGRLGAGAFATVFKFTRRLDGQVFAVKQLEARDLRKRGVWDRKVEAEVNIMKQLDHPYIVSYYGYHETERFLYIIMEFMPHGDLQTVLASRGSHLPEYQCQIVASQMCQALKYLHDRDICHRDMKPDNILIYSNDPYVFKLSDFGLSKIAPPDRTNLETFCGTMLYCAPEVYPGYARLCQQMKLSDLVQQTPRKRRRAKDGSFLQEEGQLRKTYTSAVDTWGLGAVLYHLLCGKPPWHATTSANQGREMLETIMTTAADWDELRRSGVSEHAVDFLTGMLVINPEVRTSDALLLEHRWITTNLNAIDAAEDFGSYTQQSLDNTTTRDTDRADPADLDAFASQISIASDDNTQHEGTEELPLAAMNKGAEWTQSKRKRVAASDAGSDPEDETSDSVLAEYQDDLGPTVPRRQPTVPPQRRMYGEIDQAALRSSGTLGRNAHAALGLPTQGQQDSIMSESHYEGSSELSINDFPNAQGVRQQVHPASGPAPSLMGAEALVEDLNMDSPMVGAHSQDINAGSVASQASAASQIAEAGNQTQEPTAGLAVAPSNNSSQGLYSVTPPRSPKQAIHPKPSFTAPVFSTPQQKRDATPTSNPPRETKGNVFKNPNTVNTKTPAANKDSGDSTATANAAAAQTKPPTTRAKSTNTTSPSTTKATEPVEPAPSTMVAPAPTGELGRLTAVRGSLPFGPIILTERMTTFGRQPTSGSHYSWPAKDDTRVPKLSFDIFFHREKIEQHLRLNPQLNWRAFSDIEAIITTRSTNTLMVNGVGLRQCKDHHLYGVLHTGDVVTVFEPPEGKTGEKLAFKVTIKIGESKSRRKEMEAFTVKKKPVTQVGFDERGEEGGDEKGGESTAAGAVEGDRGAKAPAPGSKSLPPPAKPVKPSKS
ncbi:MAG: hypothetical protein Q9174_002327 [Haloplaca sp. 1 TL-2023]